MRMLVSPRRTARASPCQVFASPWEPSTRTRWLRQSARSRPHQRAYLPRARSRAGWSLCSRIARRHADAVEAANAARGSGGATGGGDVAPKSAASERAKTSVCTSDPDATLTTNNKARRSEPAYKHHTAVDAERGVVLDVAVTTGAAHDTKPTEEQLDAVSAATGAGVRVATMDAGYAITRVFAALEERGIEAVVPAKAERPPKKGTIPVRRFKLDARNRLVRCPGGKLLRPHGKPDSDGFQHYRARVPDCRSCRLRPICFSPSMKRRAILLRKDHPALLRARRKYARWGGRERALYRSHRVRVEGFHGEAKTWHGLARAVRRGLANMRIQAYLTAAAVNLKRLAVVFLNLLLAAFAACARRPRSPPAAPHHSLGAAAPLLPSQAPQRRSHSAFFNSPSP